MKRIHLHPDLPTYIALLGFAFALPAAAAPLLWNPAADAGVTPGGSGSWQGTNAWYNPDTGNNETWVNPASTPYNAVTFDGTAGTISLSAQVKAGALTFETGGWIIHSATLVLDGNLTVKSGTVQIGTEANPTTFSLGGARTFDISTNAELIYVGSIGSTTLTKSGDGTLSLSANSTYVGGTIIDGGTISTSNFGSFGNASGNLAIRNNARLKVTASSDASTRAINLTNAQGGTIEVTSGNRASLNTAIGGVASAVLTKTGSGTLVLNGGRSTTGSSVVQEGTLELNGTHTAASLTVKNGAILSGTGTFGAATLEEGGRLAPGTSALGELKGTSLTWNAGGTLDFRLGNGTTSDLLNLSGALTKGSGSGAYLIHFTGAEGFALNEQTYTLIQFASTTFDLADFSFTSDIQGFGGTLSRVGNTVQFTTIPEPSAYLPLIGGGILLLSLRHRQAL